MSLMFPYSPGDQFKRADMHDLIGGSFRHGMTKCNGGNDYLLFHDQRTARSLAMTNGKANKPMDPFTTQGKGL